MPCYDPPPAYEDRERSNAHKAVQILCEECSTWQDSACLHDNPELLDWYIEHRIIDLMVEADPRTYKKDYNKIRQIEQEIIKLRFLKESKV